MGTRKSVSLNEQEWSLVIAAVLLLESTYERALDRTGAMLTNSVELKLKSQLEGANVVHCNPR